MVWEKKQGNGGCLFRIAYYCNVYLGLTFVANALKPYSWCELAHVTLLRLLWARDIQYFSCNKLSTIYTYGLLLVDSKFLIYNTPLPFLILH